MTARGHPRGCGGNPRGCQFTRTMRGGICVMDERMQARSDSVGGFQAGRWVPFLRSTRQLQYVQSLTLYNGSYTSLGGTELALPEARGSSTIVPRMGEPLIRLARAVRRYQVHGFVINPGPAGGQGSTAVLPGVRSGQNLVSVPVKTDPSFEAGSPLKASPSRRTAARFTPARS